EWTAHRAQWVGFPSHAGLWEKSLGPAQAEVAALARTLAGPGGESVRLVVRDEMAGRAAEALLDGVEGIEITPAVFGDIWLRDTGPIFTSARRAAAFRFNGWGEKYRLEGDEGVAETLARDDGAALVRHDFVLEGGALDHDGAGTVLTTRQCLLNPNRNRGWTSAIAETALAGSLGARKTIWLGDGLMNDHTDGHVDNLARFVAPATVACPMAYGIDDPNAAVYDAAARTLAASADADGRRLKVVRFPSPGRTVDSNQRSLAASHMNFLIANRAVVVPIYDERAGALAVEALEILFPDRSVIGLPSRALITGGGSFHCISQQAPA
ncbi:MAG TPA: agmatine deiminase family protein, partial [Caulobacteraceae bacterium]|nr:agmatine deiminase family protein [Caulobacteraceae bacterium]